MTRPLPDVCPASAAPLPRRAHRHHGRRRSARADRYRRRRWASTSDEDPRRAGYATREIEQRSGNERGEMNDKTGREADGDASGGRTGIIEMRPGVIRLRGYAIEDLIGRVSFPADDLADAARRTAERAPGRAARTPPCGAPSTMGRRRRRSPSRAWRRPAASASTAPWLRRSTCSATCMAAPANRRVLFIGRHRRGASTAGLALAAAVDGAARPLLRRRRKGYVPGFGHRFHPIDPRAPRLLELTSTRLPRAA